MKPLNSIVGILLISTTILLSEEVSPRGGTDGDRKQMVSDTAPSVLPPSINLGFEYKVLVLIQGTSTEDALNELGRERWELVSVVDHRDARGGSTVKAYLKRVLRGPVPKTTK
jgi:hypothetical protein